MATDGLPIESRRDSPGPAPCGATVTKTESHKRASGLSVVFVEEDVRSIKR